MSRVPVLSEAVMSLLVNGESIKNHAIDTLIKIADNILNNPWNEKYRSINLGSSVLETKLLPAAGALELLFLMGFEEADDKLVLPKEASLHPLQMYKNELWTLKTGNEMGKEVQSTINTINNSASDLKRTLITLQEKVMLYENQTLKEKARNIMPVKEFTQKAYVRLSTINENLAEKGKPMDLQDCILIELLDWFKNSFFSWFDTPECIICKDKMFPVGPKTPTSEERRYGAERVEGYMCKKCGTDSRFARYNDPEKLLETKVGRCGEWANCFTLMCRALGMDARYIYDVTDHVWTEVYSLSQERWLHADPCENKLDAPLTYEKGWGKALSYIFGISKDEIVDVTWRYSINHKQICKRRNKCDENWLASILMQLNKEKLEHFSKPKVDFLQKRLIVEMAEFFQSNRTVKADEVEGRTSGSLQWRMSRSELGNSTISGQSLMLTGKEMEEKTFVLKYSPTLDSYSRPLNDTDTTIKEWKSCINEAKQIFRKHESDWNMVYLARKEGTEKGEISWKIDWRGTGLRLKSAIIVFQHTIYNNAEIHWQACLQDVCIPGSKEGVLEIKENQAGSCTSIEISAELSGGEGTNAWQHAQLFRMPTDNKETYPFVITLKFEEKPSAFTF